MVPPLAGRAGRRHLGRPTEALGAPPPRRWAHRQPRRWALRRRGAGRSAAEAAPCRGGRAQLLLGAGLGAPPPPASSASLSFGRPGPPWFGCTPLTWSVTRWTRWACSASACAGVIAPLFTASASSLFASATSASMTFWTFTPRAWATWAQVWPLAVAAARSDSLIPIAVATTDSSLTSSCRPGPPAPGTPLPGPPAPAPPLTGPRPGPGRPLPPGVPDGYAAGACAVPPPALARVGDNRTTPAAPPASADAAAIAAMTVRLTGPPRFGYAHGGQVPAWAADLC